MKTPTALPSRTKATQSSRMSRQTTADDRRQSAELTLSSSAFARLLAGITYPNPDDSGNSHHHWGPFGPGGPVIQPWMWAALNPQPLPPGPDPYAQLSWAALNPQPLPPGPDPYRAAFTARAVIGRAAAQLDFADLLGDEQNERGIIIVSGKVMDIIEEWCGTPIPGHRGPHPHGIGLLAAGAQFQMAADTMRNSRLQSVFASAADKLFRAGLSRLQQEE
jgi:hypothetical protein